MGYLPNRTNEVIIDAVLTKDGRQKLASQGNLGITKFALSDDEVDYSLYNVDNPNGSDFYDVAIASLPVLEALPASQNSLKYKLFTNTSTVTQNVLALSISADAKIGSTSANTGVFVQGTGIDDHNTYTISVRLSNAGLLPTSIKDNVFYIAVLTSLQGRGIKDISFQGVIDTSRSLNSLSAVTSAQASLAAQNALPISQQTQIQAAGHSFTFKVLDTSAILSNVQFNVLITASGPVNATATSMVIPVNVMAATALAVQS